MKKIVLGFCLAMMLIGCGISQKQKEYNALVIATSDARKTQSANYTPIPAKQKECIVNHPLSTSAFLFTDVVNSDIGLYITNGSKCKKLGAYLYTEAGIKIPMYKLMCGGTTGHMNQKWADCD